LYSRSYGSGRAGRRESRPGGEGRETPLGRQSRPPQAGSRAAGERKRPLPPPAPPPPPPPQPPFAQPPLPGQGLLSRLTGLFGGLEPQDLLLLGLIVFLAQEEADDDILLILAALLFISS
jgi:hypothetical protein